MIAPEIKIAAAAVATVISFAAYVPYLQDMFRGKTKPHLYTWLTFFLVTITVAYSQVVGGAGFGASPTIMASIVNGVILFYCFRFGTKDIVTLDKVCLAIALLGVVSFAVLQDRPVISLAMVTVAEIVSFIPTFRKTKNEPHSESLPYYYLVTLKIVLILVSLEKYNALTVSYPITWLLTITAFLVCSRIWRAARPAPKT